VEYQGLEAQYAMTSTTPPANDQSHSLGRRLTELRLLRNLKIGTKLTASFGLLVLLTLLGVGLSVFSNIQATRVFTTTAEVRVPTALWAAQAQANLLKMQADVNGYLALGDSQYRDSYTKDDHAFSANLQQLDNLAPKLSPADQKRLTDLEQAYKQWQQYPDRLFALRDDQLAREPAYNLLTTQGVELGGTVLIDAGKLIDDQALRTPSQETVGQLADMARFQGSFSAMMSGLRGYVTTRNRIFRSEYEANYDLNQIAWERLRSDAPALDATQQALIVDMNLKLTQFLTLPDKMFAILEGDHYREDLYLFRTQALPTSETMLTALGDLTNNQQVQLLLDLDQGKHGLASTTWSIEIGGILVLLLAIATGVFLYGSIAGPVRRLTNTAERVKAGDLAVQARVEATDEIGILAGTFNRMTAQLRQTLDQIRREKKRADDLLNVVIPIGVQLSSEKDYNRLLENILVKAKSFCNAQAGILFLHTAEDCLEYVIVRDDRLQVAMGGTTGQEVPLKSLPLRGAPEAALNHNLAVRAAIDGTSINIPNAIRHGDFNYSEPADGLTEAYDHEGQISCLAIPLKDSAGQVTGVLQLASAEDPETGQVAEFDANLQQMMESFSSLAVAALEAYSREQGLKLQIQQLRIEIDEVKRQQQVREIVETDFFQDLQSKARVMRGRHKRPGARSSAERPSADAGKNEEQP
jgi:CHASE3 domain sensor protein